MGVSFRERTYLSLERHESTEFRAVREGAWLLSQLVCYTCLGVLLAVAAGSVYIVYRQQQQQHSLLLLQPLAICGACLVATRSLLSHVNEEKITIIHGHGIELKRQYSTGVVKTKFLGDGSISAVLLHESIAGAGVHYCLAFVVQGDARLTLGFKHVYPGLASVRAVYAEAVRSQGLVEPGAKRPPFSGLKQ